MVAKRITYNIDYFGKRVTIAGYAVGSTLIHRPFVVTTMDRVQYEKRSGWLLTNMETGVTLITTPIPKREAVRLAHEIQSNRSILK